MEYLASMYIDDELDLDEKFHFIDKIHNESMFYRTTRELLDQERLLRIVPDTSRVPSSPPRLTRSNDWLRKALRPIVYATAGFAAAVLIFYSAISQVPQPDALNRFVIYEPHAHQVELAGSFTEWEAKPMRPVGKSGYWELILRLPLGEHRFAYILDGNRQIADPTVPKREKDDFGGENSILNVGERV